MNALTVNSGGSSIRPNLPCGRHELGDALVVLVGECEARHQRDGRQLELLDLLFHRLAVVDHRMRAETEAPFLRLRPRRGREHRQPGEAAGELDQDRANAASAARDQERARIDTLAGHRTEPIEQQFPGGDGGEREGGGLHERQALRLVANDALVDEVEFRIGTLAQDRAGVKYLVAWLEQRDVGTDGVDNAGRVIAQNLGLALGRGCALAHLVIDRIGRDRLHSHADITALGFGLGGLEIEQRVLILDRKRLPVADGLHGLSPSDSVADAGSRVRVFARPRDDKRDLALQLLCLRASESMGNHDSNVVDAGRVD
ncbi:hypothetical protein ACVWXM_007660 [Bradyrhizobium sp. GM7.3]